MSASATQGGHNNEVHTCITQNLKKNPQMPWIQAAWIPGINDASVTGKRC